MLDVAITVTGAHPGTTVHAVSRHALLPRDHRYPPGAPLAPGPRKPAALGPGILARGPVSLPALIRNVRAAAADAPDDWQCVVDSLRPHVAGLWQALTPEDKRVFLRSVARYWEVHRHRVPPATAGRIGLAQIHGPGGGAPGPRHRGHRGSRRPSRPDRAAWADGRDRGRLADQRHRSRHGHHRYPRPAAARPARRRPATPDPLRLGFRANAGRRAAGPSPADQAARSSRSGRRFGDSCTRPRPCRRSATRPPRSRHG